MKCFRCFGLGTNSHFGLETWKCYCCGGTGKQGVNRADGTPRRIDVNLSVPAEQAIRNAMKIVEQEGCDVLLTDAVILLEQALNKVADYVDQEISK